jgi:DNA-binding NarL/FixJ family response regulator
MAIAEQGRAVVPKVSVLLVDDDDDVRYFARAALDIDGRFDVVGEGSDGREAVLLVEHLHPDVVVLDLEMPWLSGAEAIPEIRRVSPATLVVVWTVDPCGLRAADALALGATVVLDKAACNAAALGHSLIALVRESSGRPAD